ncbi:hypothetical protein AB0J35_18435 [Nonomuraea angiospora]|uniref:hypothetical protein n=1 Tax=Nonomuraea angiospora TaxID=46172 RepID=UPI00343C2BD1
MALLTLSAAPAQAAVDDPPMKVADGLIDTSDTATLGLDRAKAANWSRAGTCDRTARS